MSNQASRAILSVFKLSLLHRCISLGVLESIGNPLIEALLHLQKTVDPRLQAFVFFLQLNAVLANRTGLIGQRPHRFNGSINVYTELFLKVIRFQGIYPKTVIDLTGTALNS